MINLTLPKELKHSVIFYGLLSLIAFFPCLFMGQAYFDNDLLAQFGPWRAFLRDQLAQGHFPLWNPFSLGGQPFFADLQNMMLYPFNYLTLPFSVPMGLSFFFFIHMFWAALGMHLWLRSLELSENASRAGAVLFAFSGFFWLELIHPPVLAAFAWLPWVFGNLESMVRDSRPPKAFWTGLSFAMLFLCGSLQVTLGAFYGGLVYLLFRLAFNKNSRNGPLPFKTLILLVLFLVWGALPLLGQLIPTQEFAGLSTRDEPNAQTEKVSGQTSLNPATLGRFFFPRTTLSPGQDMAEALQSDKNGAAFSFAANWGYMGPWVLLLALFAFRREEKAAPLFWAGFSLLALLFCFGRYLPLHGWLSFLLPGLSLIQVPYRFLYLYVLALSVLAAYGFDHWQSDEKSEAPSKNRSVQYAAYALILFVCALLHSMLNWREIVGLVLGTAALFPLPFARPLVRKAAPGLLICALWLPLLLNGWADFKPGPSSNFDFVKNSGSIAQAAKKIGEGRVIFFNQEMYYPIQVEGKKYLINYPQNASCAFPIKNFGGYNPLMLRTKAEIGTLPLKPLIQLGAIAGILAQKDHGTIPGFEMEPLPPYLLYRSAKHPPLLFAPAQLEIIPESSKRLARLRDPGFDPNERTILPVLDRAIAAQISSAPAQVSAQLQAEEPDLRRYKVDLDRGALVVFTEVMYPGWKALVDGVEVPIYTADHFLRSICLPAGHHQVEFRFKPSWMNPLRILFIVWLMGLAAFFLWGRKLIETGSYA